MGCSDYLSYNSVKYIRVHDWRLGATYYALVLLIFAYVLSGIIINKQYNAVDTPFGTTTLKAKGSASPPGDYNKVYDTNDLILPPLQPNSLFIVTAFIETQQTRGICSGNDKGSESCQCEQFNKNETLCCAAGRYTINGITTGTCNKTTNFCDIHSWCPLEEDSHVAPQALVNIDQWTILIRVNVKFPAFNITLANAASIQRGLNLFSVEEILELANTTYGAVGSGGGILLGNVYYDCDFNSKDGVSSCQPQYTYDRIDNSEGSSASSGFNYRYTINSVTGDGAPSRLLRKVWGIRIMYTISGAAGKFDIVKTGVAVGSGLALLGISSFIVDFLMQYIMPTKEKIMLEKYAQVQISSPHGTTELDKPFVNE